MARTVGKLKQSPSKRRESRKKLQSKPEVKKEFKTTPERTKKKPQQPLESWKRKRVIKLHKQGLTVVKIAATIGIGNACVSKILKKYRETGSVDPGIPGTVSKVYTPEIVRKIVELKRENPNIYAWEIRDRLIPDPPASCISSINRILRVNQSEWKPEKKVVRRRFKKRTALTPEIVTKIWEYKSESPCIVVRRIRERLLSDGVCDDLTLPSFTTLRRFLRKSNMSLRQVLKRLDDESKLTVEGISNITPPSDIFAEVEIEDDAPPSGLSIPSLLRRERLTSNQGNLFDNFDEEIVTSVNTEKQKKSKKDNKSSLVSKNKKENSEMHTEAQTADDESNSQTETILPPKKRKVNRVGQSNNPFDDQTVNVSILKDFAELCGSIERANVPIKRPHRVLKHRKVYMDCLGVKRHENDDLSDSNAQRLYKKGRSRESSPFRNFDQSESAVDEPCRVIRLDEIDTYSCLSSQHQMNRITYTHSSFNANTRPTGSDFRCATSSGLPRSDEQDSIETTSLNPSALVCKLEKSSPSQDEESLEQFQSTRDELQPPPLVDCFSQPPPQRRIRHRHVKFEIPIDLVLSS